MNSISEIIRPDIEIFGNDSTHWTSDDIQNGVNYWKEAIYAALNGETVGKSVHIASSTLFVVLCCMKATWELGANVFNQSFPQGIDNVSAFKDFYDFISVKIVHNDFGFKDTRKHLYIRDFDPYVKHPFRVYPLNGQISDKTVAITTHSSGTACVPELIEYDHRTVIDSIPEIVRMCSLSESDIPLHYKTLHHGSLFKNWTIPLMSVCKIHHSVEGEYSSVVDDWDDPIVFFNTVLPYIKQHGITQMLCLYDWLNHLPKADVVDLSALNLSSFTVLSKEPVYEIFDKFNLKQLSIRFGSSEFGIMFLATLTGKNVAGYELGKYSIINQDLEYEFYPTYTLGRLKNKNRDWVATADMFKKGDDYILFCGRNENTVVNGETIDVDMLRKYINTLSTNCSLVPDLERSKLYLAVYDNKMPDNINQLLRSEFGPNYLIHRQAYIDISPIRRGVKPTNPILLHYFRKITTDE
jgi:hypothetical protein